MDEDEDEDEDVDEDEDEVRMRMRMRIKGNIRACRTVKAPSASALFWFGESRDRDVLAHWHLWCHHYDFKSRLPHGTNK